ncbi:hypothetical protein ABID30_002210 [Enterococcus rotai]|uniref:Uncharacterized protein n=1 Tax=Enterococcus rotai TaxID=118060 RepID=A0A0U2NTG8_9ENTE|nr:hypothetical protein [Enterococcus rotai]ALS38482.1 hypothetical protein ATZ35_15410 [Enterococcus rotai]
MKKWEVARYMIDAKKSVDSIMFININHSELQHIDLRKKINDLRDDFYIKCAIVIDKTFTNRKERSNLKNKDEILEKIFKERDKNSAHKDEDYIPKEYSSMSDIIADMQNEVIQVRKICANNLPDVLSLDFVPYDRELFRSIHRITKKEEDAIVEKKIAINQLIFKDEIDFDNEATGSNFMKIFSDTEDLKLIDENVKSDYVVIFENGLTLYEGIQNRQDSCIKLNVLHNTDIWVTINKKNLDEIMELKEIGFLNEFDAPDFDLFLDGNYEEKMDEIICSFMKRKNPRRGLAL